MAAIIRELKSIYDATLESGDPRVAEWPLMSSPLPVMGIIALYQVFVRHIGPKMMENRPPMELKKIMIVYNVVVILMNFWFVWESLFTCYIRGGYHLYKQQVDYSTDPLAVHVASMIWWYFVSKILDLLDTVFIVLRKKDNQLSFLHTYHHSLMVGVIWVTTKYFAGGSLIIVGAINGFVHMVMYFYYLLTLINPEYKTSVWWKRHLTELQMVQFLILLTVVSFIISYSDSTKVQILVSFFLPQDLFMFVMFLNFYKKTYFRRKQDTSKES